MLAPKGSFPWQVLLNVDGGRAGGMVIDHKWILTAASNLMRGDNQILKSQVKVFVGDNNVRNLTQSTPLEVASLHIHPGYNNPNYLSYDNDIALIKLQKSLQFSSNIMRVCLPVKGAEYTIGRVGWVSGFGIRDDDIISKDLRFVRVPLVSQLTCRRSIDEERANRVIAPDLTDNMFCAGLPEGGKDACHGDGGSPYVLKYGEFTGLQGSTAGV
ncbi:hypothetical protein DPEC_G00144060 [Dallia pectoralis]|uniref:Uncharacterized protein n=1 Tax=Dallia pectoralis TaxID=75939 RepID=A0ACC2GNR1_DALPE|nr:hypothetical protein DPEC_G00144060 [Dallia pectoralis]